MTETLTVQNQIHLSLLSGLIGSVAGGILSFFGSYLAYKGTMDAAKKQIEHLYQQEKESRLWQMKQQEISMLKFLLSEAKENLDLANRLYTSFEVVAFTMQAWSNHKGAIISQPQTLQDKFVSAYTEMRRYNSWTDDREQTRVLQCDDKGKTPFQRQAGIIQNALSSLIEELDRIIKE